MQDLKQSSLLAVRHRCWGAECEEGLAGRLVVGNRSMLGPCLGVWKIGGRGLWRWRCGYGGLDWIGRFGSVRMRCVCGYVETEEMCRKRTDIRGAQTISRARKSIKLFVVLLYFILGDPRKE